VTIAAPTAPPPAPPEDQFFATEVNKIWAQAGIGVFFSPIQNIYSTLFSNIDRFQLRRQHLLRPPLRIRHRRPSTTTVDLFLTHTVAGAYGEGWLGLGGIVIAMDDVMAYNSGNGRIDTIAH
jgi:hypothetical protein